MDQIIHIRKGIRFIKHEFYRPNWSTHIYIAGEIRGLTSILAGNEIDPVAELNLQATVAHEVLQSDSLDDAWPGTLTEARDGVFHGWVWELGFSCKGHKESPKYTGLTVNLGKDEESIVGL